MLYEIHSISLLTAITIFKPKKAYDNMGIWPVTSARQVSRWRNICGGLVRNFTCNLKERPSQVFNSCHTKYFLVEFLMGFAAKWAIYDYKAHNKRGWLQLLGCCGCLGSSWWTRTYLYKILDTLVVNANMQFVTFIFSRPKSKSK